MRDTPNGMLVTPADTRVVGTFDELERVDVVTGGLATLLSSLLLLLLRLAACSDAPAFSTSSFVTPYSTLQRQ